MCYRYNPQIFNPKNTANPVTLSTTRWCRQFLSMVIMIIIIMTIIITIIIIIITHAT